MMGELVTTFAAQPEIMSGRCMHRITGKREGH